MNRDGARNDTGDEGETAGVRSRTVFSGARWNALGDGAVQVVRLLVSIVLFRMVGPEAAGLVALAMVVTGFLDLFNDFGTGQVVIQRRELSQPLLTTVFYINLLLGAVAFTVLATGSGLVAAWMDEAAVGPLLRVLGLNFLIASTGLVHRSLLARALAFDRIALVNLVKALTYGVVALGHAVAGFGVWSLVFGTLAGSLVSTWLVWRVSPWRPSGAPRLAHVREVQGFCLNLVGANLSNYFLQSADRFIIGRFLGVEALGYYALGQRVVITPIRSLSNVLGAVLVPAFSRLQDDLVAFRAKYLRACSGVALVTFPVMVGSAIVAGPAVRSVMGAEWLPAIPVLILLCPVGLVRSVAGTTGAIYVATGSTGLMFRWSVVFGTCLVLSYAVGLPWGIAGVTGGLAVASALLAYPYFAVPFRLIELPFGELVAALRAIVVANLVLAAGAGAAHLLLRGAGAGDVVIFVGCVVAGVLSYVAGLWGLRPAALEDLRALVQPRWSRVRSSPSPP